MGWSLNLSVFHIAQSNIMKLGTMVRTRVATEAIIVVVIVDTITNNIPAVAIMARTPSINRAVLTVAKTTDTVRAVTSVTAKAVTSDTAKAATSDTVQGVTVVDRRTSSISTAVAREAVAI